VAPRTVRYYVQRGLLPPPSFRGKDTTYGPEHLARLRAIKQLQQEGLPLDAIQARLASATLAELERITGSKTRAPAAELRVTAPHAKTPYAGGPYRSAPRVSAPPGERWERIVLLPGLELHVREGANAEVQRAAEEICTQYASTPDHEE